MTVEDVYNFLKSKNYTVELEAKNKTLVANFPKRILGAPLSGYCLEYRVLKQGVKIVGENVNYLLKCPQYARELLVSYDIILRSQILMYSEKLIDFSPIEQVQFCEEEQKEKRDRLLIFLNKYVFNGLIADLESEDVLEEVEAEEIKEGYLDVINFMQKGILYDTHLVKELAE